MIMITKGYIAIRIPEAEPFSREGAVLAPALKWLQYMKVISEGREIWAPNGTAKDPYKARELG